MARKGVRCRAHTARTRFSFPFVQVLVHMIKIAEAQPFPSSCHATANKRLPSLYLYKYEDIEQSKQKTIQLAF